MVSSTKRPCERNVRGGRFIFIVLVAYNVSVAGHSHWAGIKRQKEVADKKRGQVFSKLLAAITASAKAEPNPDFNPRLRTVILKAKECKVPAENIERAVRRASETEVMLEELIMEAYGPGGIAILIEALSNNKNRTVAEVKKILSRHHAKWAEPGSVRWAFEPPTPGETAWQAKFPQVVSEDDKNKLSTLEEVLLEHDDVQNVFTNAT